MSSTAPTIVLVEDDPTPAKNLHKKLSDEFSRGQVKRIRTEREFRSHLDEFSGKPPDVIVLDVMLPWTDTENLVPAPKDVYEEGVYRAGFRCIKLLADKITTRIPCIVYTVLARSALDKEFNALPDGLRVEYLQKDPDRTRLFNLIRKLTRHSNR